MSTMNPFRRSGLARSVLALVATLISAGCSDSMDVENPPARPHDERVFSLPAGQPEFDALPGATAFHGTHDGIEGEAGYRIEVPDVWNGVLVMWAHGYRGTTTQLAVSTPPSALRAHLIANGYAWAASSYSANYYDVRAGVEDTNALALAFEALTGRAAPAKRYILGASMGGHVAAAAVEAETMERARSLVTYAASLPFCGVVADNELSSYYYALAIGAREVAGISVTSFPMTDFGARLGDLRDALWVDYGTDPFDLTPAGEQFKHLFARLSGGPRPTFDETFPLYLDLLFDRGSGEGTWTGILGGVSANTVDIVYQLDADPAVSPDEQDFNDDTFRIEGDLGAHNPPRSDGVRALPLVEGRFDVPVLTVHTLEARVPLRMEQIYAMRAAANGNADRLVQRVIRSGAHCDFADDEWTESFDALVAWETTGTVPAGDDVLDAAEVADPEYGCQFTRATRPGIPACP